jgi:hypothetical protein
MVYNTVSLALLVKRKQLFVLLGFFCFFLSLTMLALATASYVGDARTHPI